MERGQDMRAARFAQEGERDRAANTGLRKIFWCQMSATVRKVSGGALHVSTPRRAAPPESVEVNMALNQPLRRGTLAIITGLGQDPAGPCLGLRAIAEDLANRFPL